jgi:hypothetical protein
MCLFVVRRFIAAVRAMNGATTNCLFVVRRFIAAARAMNGADFAPAVPQSKNPNSGKPKPNKLSANNANIANHIFLFA